MKVQLKLLPHQMKLLASKAGKTILICGRGAGKSYVLAVLILMALFMGQNVMVGGQRYDTLHDTLYAEIKRLAAEWGVYDLIEWREAPMQMRYNGHYVYFGTYESVDASRGYTNISKMILDEAFLAPIDILSVWGPCMRGPEVKNPQIYGATTPRMDSMWNVLMTSPECDWEIIRARTRDNVFITDEQYKLMLSGIATEEMRRQELEGELVVGSMASALIRMEDFPAYPAMSLDTSVMAGLDCGEGVERDSTAFFKRRGKQTLEMWKLNGINHEETVRLIRESNKRLPITKLNMDMAFSDYEFNILKYEIPCEQIPFARSPSDENREKFVNIRAEMAFNFTAMVKSGLCVEGFPLTPELKRQACSLAWRKNSQGRLLITPKEELRAVLKMSTDILDAGMLSCVEVSSVDDPTMNVENVQGVTEEELESMMGED